VEVVITSDNRAAPGGPPAAARDGLATPDLLDEPAFDTGLDAQPGASPAADPTADLDAGVFLSPLPPATPEPEPTGAGDAGP
jgi:hypothetical protein